MPDEKQIYWQDALRYDRLVEREDYQKRLLPALQGTLPFECLDIVELGAGTGRLTCLIAPMARRMVAFDLSRYMLAVAGERLRSVDSEKWSLAVADHRWIPAPPASADLIISGWSVCYLVVWHPESWQIELDRALAEMKRILRPGGRVIIIETLGTGETEPVIPAKLGGYYAYLEEHGFSRFWIRTDYRFLSYREAEELAAFFFGPEMLARLIPDPESGAALLPECTGIWNLRFAV